MSTNYNDQGGRCATQRDIQGQELCPAGYIVLAKRISKHERPKQDVELLCSIIKVCGYNRRNVVKEINLLFGEILPR